MIIVENHWFPIQGCPHKLPSTGTNQNTPWLLCTCSWSLYTNHTTCMCTPTPTLTQQLHCRLSKPFSFAISLIQWMLLWTLLTDRSLWGKHSTALQFGYVPLPISNPNAYSPIASKQQKRSMPQMILTVLLKYVPHNHWWWVQTLLLGQSEQPPWDQQMKPGKNRSIYQ